jgi:hypothetical protein
LARWNRGDLVELDGLLAVVVGIEGDDPVPEEHVALWFGNPRCERISKGGPGGQRPEILTVPEEYCVPAAKPVYKH